METTTPHPYLPHPDGWRGQAPTKKQLALVLELHKKWRAGEEGGIHADLSGADLSRANLSGADLSDANLSGADLRGAKHIAAFGPAPSSGRMVFAVAHESGPLWQAGCFWGTSEELAAKVAEVHTGKNRDWYEAVIALGKIQLS
jgi:hypothetical protein